MTTKQAGLEEAKTGMAALEVVNEHGEIVKWEDFGQADWEDDGTEDVQPSFPYIKITQGTSTMEGAGKHGGDFWHSDTEEYTPTLNVVALVMRETRALFGDENSEAPACVSADGHAPLPDQPQWSGAVQPETCGDCPFSSWGPNNEAPKCKASKVLLVDRGAGDLAQLRVSGKSIKPLRQFIARRCKPKRRPLYSFRLELSTRELSEPGKKWHELVVDAEDLTPQEAMGYSELLRAQRTAFEETLKKSSDTARTEWPDEVPSADSGWETE